MASIINIGVSALNTFQRQLATTGHNIANVNTEGYSRQRVDFNARPAESGSSATYGTGVEINGIRRTYNDFLAGRVRDHNSSEQEYSVFYGRASQVDNVIADSAAGLDASLQKFFDSVQDVASDPTSIPARNVMLSQAEVLVDRFDAMDDWLSDLRRQTNRDLEQFSNEINGLGQSIASLNGQIQEASRNQSSPPNDLLDSRDKLIDDLSKYVSVTTLEQNDGSTNVYIGSGQALVVGGDYNTLSVTNNDQASDRKEISISLPGGGLANITEQLSGGRIGGVIRFREEILDPAQNSLGLVAIGLADSFNAEHITGLDLDGDLGTSFFSIASPEVLGSSSNSGTVTGTFDDVSNLKNSEYNFNFDGTNWSLTDLTNGNAVALTGLGTVGSPFVAEGMSLVVNAGAAAGDSYRLRPTRQGANAINTLITDSRDIAAAESIISAEASANTGTGHMSAGAQVTSTGTTKLAAPITMTFNNATNLFTLSSGGTLAYDPSTDSGNTLTVSIAGLGDYSFEMTGTPDNGDQYTLSDNTGGIGDNRNASRLADIQGTSLLFGDTSTLSDVYGYLVSDVGTGTAQAKSNSDVQSKLLIQAENAKTSISGVNLDEEAADLVRFQQAYQAAAQIINTANTLFDALINAAR